MRQRRPRALVRATIAAWIRRGGVDMGEFEPGPFDTVEAFFLRRLLPGHRPLADAAAVSPVDGVVVSAGTITGDTVLVVKGHPMSLRRLVGGPVDHLVGGLHTTIFLTPDGYHHVHAPVDARVHAVRPIAGASLPQNADALQVLDRVYERNARAVVSLTLGDGAPVVLVMVGASLISGIHVDVAPGQQLERGARLGCFAFGSTVVLLAAPGLADEVAVGPGDGVRMGEALWLD